MDISFVLKIAGVGLIVAISYQMLQRMGRDEQATIVSLAGVIMALVLVVGEIDRLLDTVKNIFGL